MSAPAESKHAYIGHTGTPAKAGAAVGVGGSTAGGETDTKSIEEQLAALNITVERGVRAPIMEAKGKVFTEKEEEDRVYIFKSGIPNTGNGVWARKDFKSGDLVVEFYGKRFDDWTKTYSSCKYAFEITTPSGRLAYIDGYGVGVAAKIANDASGAIRVPGLVNNCTFSVLGERVFIVASKDIPAGTEIFVQYGRDYWYMTEEEYTTVYEKFTVLDCKRMEEPTHVPQPAEPMPDEPAGGAGGSTDSTEAATDAAATTDATAAAVETAAS